VQRALGDRVKEVFYFSDSEVGICWVLNTKRQQRMWVHNRVEAIRTAIKWTVGDQDTLPLFHIPGVQNLADLLTKPQQVGNPDLDTDSAWQTGLPWMRVPLDSLPRRQPYVLPSPELVKVYEDEMFQIVESQQADERGCLLEHRDCADYLSNPFSCGAVYGHSRDVVGDQTHLVRVPKLGPEEKVGSARSEGPKVGWFNNTFKFGELG
jgi:hypothetical protein